MESFPGCYGGDFWDHVKMLGCWVDELPVYYGGDLWNPDGDDIVYTGNYESSDYEDPRDFFSR